MVANVRDEVSAAIADESVRRVLRIHVMVVGAGLVLLGTVAILASALGVEGSTLTREPQITLNGALYTGALSNLGALVWMVAVSMAVVGVLASTGRRDQLMFGLGALLGLALLVDDFFLVHDWLKTVTRVLERGLLASYFPAILALAWFYRRELGRAGVVGLLISLGFLGLSASMDLLLNDLDQIAEDGLKFLGICTWTTTWIVRLRPWELRRADAGRPNAQIDSA